MKRVLILFMIIGIVSFLNGDTGSYQGKLKFYSTEKGIMIISQDVNYMGPECGNRILETYNGEQCDKSDLGGKTCSSLLGDSYSGVLKCTSQCIWDISECFLIRNKNQSEEQSPQNNGGGGSVSSSNTATPEEKNKTLFKGSSSKEEKCIERWICEEWRECVNGVSQRKCRETNKCGTELLKPPTKKSCKSKKKLEKEIILNESEKEGLAGVTGAFTFIKDNKVRIVSSLVSIIIVLVILLTILKKNKK